MIKTFCKICGSKKLWKLANGEYRCSVCRRDFKPYPIKGLRFNKQDLRKLVKLFLLGVNIPTLAKELKRSQQVIGKTLRLIRVCMRQDIPKEIFSGTVEVDETYLGGQKKNRRKSQLIKDKEIFGKESKRGFGTTKQPVFGILCRSGKVFARLVEDIEAKDLMPIIRRKVLSGSKVCSDTWRAYTGLATKGYVHRTVEHQKKEYIKGRKNHINGLEGFWGYLKRKLAAKGGIRRKYLYLFLAEYVWRYNNKNYSLKEQTDRLLVNLYTNFGAKY